MPCLESGFQSLTKQETRDVDRAFWNCSHGLVAKQDIVEYYIKTIKPLAFFISEAEINIKFDYSCLSINNYDLLVSKSVQHGKARSVAYVMKGSGYVRNDHLENDLLETIVISNASSIICGVYRPFKTVNNMSNNEAFLLLIEGLENVTKVNKNIIIGGDFNIDWQKTTTKKNLLENWAESSGLIQLVDIVTRRREVSKADGSTQLQSSCLDLVFAATPVKVDVLPAIQSDHDVISVQTRLPKPPVVTKKTVIVDWRKYSKDAARYELSKLMCKRTLICPQTIDSLTSDLIGALNAVAPNRVVRIRGEDQFVNSKIESVKKKRDRVWKKFKQSGDISLLKLSRELTKTLRRTIAKEKKRVFRAKISSHGCQGFWKLVNETFNVNSRDELSLESEGVTITDGETIANLFSDFFVQKVDNLASNFVAAPLNYRPYSCVQWIPFSVSEVEKATKGIKNKRSSGPDELPMCMVKDCADLIIRDLHRLFNDCVANNFFPEEWKLAKVTPIHKKGKKTLVENYRPVSGLATLSKIFERCILARLEGLVEDDWCQHGFRPGHGTVTACLEVQHHIAKALDNKKKVLMYTLDMSAAFDLLRKELLELGAVPCELSAIIMNFLSDRRAFVKIGQDHSTIRALKYGVPQGSVLGPKLFSYYTKKLRSIVSVPGVDVVSYADDSFVVCQAESLVDVIKLTEKVLTTHVNWLGSVGMVVNAKKTELVHFGKETVELTIQGSTIKSANDVRVLGCWFDSGLTWEKNVQMVVNSCQRLKPALRCLKKKTSRQELLQVITSHYYSRLYYASEVWLPCLNSRLKQKITTMHFYPLRLTLGDYKRALSYRQITKLTNRAPPNELIDFKIARTLISICSNSEPYALFHELVASSSYTSRLPLRPRFYDLSRTRVGRQSFPNRVRDVASKLNFDWLGLRYEEDCLRPKLKNIYFLSIGRRT